MSDQSPAPAPEAKEWVPPTSDQEFVFDNPDSLPAWIDPSMRGFKDGPALALPAGDVYGTGPYTTKVAKVGDTVLFKVATPSKPAHFEVVEGEPVEDQAQKKPPQQSPAALEDLIRTGWLPADELSADAKGQVLGRSPRLKQLIEEGAGAPEAVPVGDYVKTA